MDKRYKHSDHEESIYKLWEEGGGFVPKSDGKAEPYTIIMPPPNANDPLHIGHAMFVTIEDVLIRYNRMRGRAALWLPGTDHAGIETQYVFEKKLAKKGKSRFDYDRETLYKMVWDYVRENSGTALTQMKKLGASADWDRYKFTLDKDVVAEVLKTFVELDKDGLVYRDLALVNYCTHCGTAFSDLESVQKEQKAKLYFVRYPMVEGEGSIVIATTRPEPIYADTHLAVNPKDKKNKHLIGKKVLNPLTDREMEIIGDEFVDPEFGTGVVKLTPAHDPNDFGVAMKHGLPMVQAIDTSGKMVGGGELAGMKVPQARERAVELIEEKGLLEKVDENYTNSIKTCYRCGRALEPLPLAQFFIKVKSMVKKSLAALKSGDVKVYGSGHDKVLKHWLENLYDWNVSRQIVWGIRMPVWYGVNPKLQAPNSKLIQNSNGEIEVKFLDEKGELKDGKIFELLGKHSLGEISKGLQELRAPVGAVYEISPTSPGKNYIQETDTFDTWFSSSQWPFVTLKTGKASDDYERFYPTQVMETGYDILPFWVMRMLMMGLYKTGKVPFKNVYLHGLIRDEKGQKMSKSKGNVINPLSVVEQYGADALRMALVIRSSAGQDKNMGVNDVRAMRNLTNKIWNSARYVMMRLESKKVTGFDELQKDKDAEGDKEFEERLNRVIEELGELLERFKIGLAADMLYNSFWHWFCDECIEKNKETKLSDKALFHGLVVYLKLLHPFVPFVTEAVYQELRNNKDLVSKSGDLLGAKELMNAEWVSLADPNHA